MSLKLAWAPGDPVLNKRKKMSLPLVGQYYPSTSDRNKGISGSEKLKQFAGFFLFVFILFFAFMKQVLTM